ncbi:hypothetical protein [Mesorhizobium sp.]|uniref:AbiTii domain-containing protein n=1 Tax=Mesorhizobium sp. TaxID=1871066 RepID=UPI000FE6A67E|nr:hypothetical protein [Mesorhizobium sp.]RWO21749.1 MAG: hypothetical protein EOS09_22335 [Mesorhizobium sp.]
MALLHDIQSALLDEKVGVGSTLLKLRFLASKLGSDVLEEWVKHEADGYPKGAEVPDYRTTGVVYTGTFVDIARQLNNVPIPKHLIRKHGGDHWVDFKIRDSLSVIDAMISRSEKGETYGIDCGNLILLLQGKVYDGMSCIAINSSIDIGAFVRVQQTVRSKVLDLTLELEKNVPAAAEIMVGQSAEAITPEDKAQVTHLMQQVFYGDVTNISSTGSSAQITLNVAKGSTDDLISALTGKGIPKKEAEELAAIAAAEQPEGVDEPFGKKGAKWLADKAKKGAMEIWGIGKEVGTQVVKEALMQYYGLK